MCTGGNNLNRVRRNLAGALLWFLWLRQGPSKLMSSELRKYDWINKPESLRKRLSISWSNTLLTLRIHIYSYANEVNRNGSRGRAEKKGRQYHHQYDLEWPNDQALDLISTHNLDKPGEQNERPLSPTMSSTSDKQVSSSPTGAEDGTDLAQGATSEKFGVEDVVGFEQPKIEGGSTKDSGTYSTTWILALYMVRSNCLLHRGHI